MTQMDSRSSAAHADSNPLPSHITFTFSDALRQFETHLEAGLKSEETIKSYLISVKQAAVYLEAQGLPDDVAVLTREHIEMFIAALGKRVSPATVVNRFKGLRAFFSWLQEEGEIKNNPMARMDWPKQEDKAPSACTPKEVRKMLDACGKNFTGRRDAALIGFMVDTGWRVSEVLAVTVEMVQTRDKIVVRGKGRKALSARLTPTVQRLVDRYLRVRKSPRPELWLSRSGKPLDRHGAWEIVAARSKQVGLKVHPHSLRHSHAIWWLEEGGNLADLSENLGHSDIRVTQRYLRHMAQDRALKARERFGPGNRLAD